MFSRVMFLLLLGIGVAHADEDPMSPMYEFPVSYQKQISGVLKFRPPGINLPAHLK